MHPPLSIVALRNQCTEIANATQTSVAHSVHADRDGPLLNNQQRGRGGIRTHGRFNPTLDFESSALNRTQPPFHLKNNMLQSWQTVRFPMEPSTFSSPCRPSPLCPNIHTRQAKMVLRDAVHACHGPVVAKAFSCTCSHSF